MPRLFLNSSIIVSLMTYQAFAKDLKILNIYNTEFDIEEYDGCLESIHQINPDVIFVFNKSMSSFENFYHTSLHSEYSFYCKKGPHCALLSKNSIAYIEQDTLDENNFILSFAFDEFPKLYHLAHLPHLNTEDQEMIKSYYLATHPYIRLSLEGDFNNSYISCIEDYNQSCYSENETRQSFKLASSKLFLFDPIYLTPQELDCFLECADTSAGIKTSADTKGNKQIEFDVTSKSDSGSFTVQAKAGYQENYKGEKAGSAQVEARINFGGKKNEDKK